MQARKFIGGMRKGGGAGLLLAAILVCGGGFRPSAWGAPPAKSPEDQAFEYAFDRFQDFHYPQAETNFGDFLAKYTNSTHRADAILYLARARLYQSNFTGAIDLLQKSSTEAGGLKPDYLFWMAKARYASGDLTNAAEGFAAVAKDFPLSPRRLEASYDQAETCSRMGDWTNVIGLLRQADGPFQLAAAQDAKSEFAGLGWLLLGGALLHENRPVEGETVVSGFDPAGMTQDLHWHRQYLLCRLQLAGGRAQAALTTSTNALELALDPRRQAMSVFLQGEILEKLGRPAEALGVYAKNLVDSQTQEVQWQALSRTIPLTVALNPLPQAIQALDALIKQHPQTKAQDLAQVSLGELYLKAFASPPIPAAESNAPPVTGTNLLASALTNFNMVITNITNSPLLAKARLDRGWCDWLLGNIGAAKVDFEEAAAGLPFSQDQAVARFKLADAQFFLKDFSRAASNYSLVLTHYDQFPEVTNALFDLALYQIAEAGIHRGDEEGAEEARAAVGKILRWYPGSYFGDRGSLLRGEDLLLLGEDLNRSTNYAKAREVFLGVLARSSHSPFLPELEYAIARTHDYEGHWTEAITRYKQWETNHAGDSLLPEVEYQLALACGKAGLTNDALSGFTNYVVRFPTNALAPWALNWVADYYYNQKDANSENVILAEKYYQELFQIYPDAGDLAYQARFWAAKSALKRQGTADALVYFKNLVNLTNAPPALVARGYFALGDTFFQQFLFGQTNEDYLGQAITAISKCTNGAPTNTIAVEALGRLGDYYKAWADKNPDTNNYAIVKQMYETIVNFPPASAGVSVAARSQAEFGLGLVAEKQKQPLAALAHYLNVLDFSPDRFDPYWVERAGEYAARICEDQQHWDEAVRVYKRVLEAVPAMRPVLEKKRAAAQARWDAAGN
jgi:tetratricopeptide (TPR) repeat protein